MSPAENKEWKSTADNFNQYLKIGDDFIELRVFPAGLIEERNHGLEIADIVGVHLQKRTLLHENVGQSGIGFPVEFQHINGRFHTDS